MAAEKKKNDGYKEYKDNIIPASSLLEVPVEVVSVGPSLNMGLYGGVSSGTIGIIVGQEKIGKTTTALTIAANAHESNPDRKIIYANIEGRRLQKTLRSVHNLNPDSVEVIQSERGKILCAEDFCDIIEKKVIEFPGCVMIIDSVSALVSQDEMDKGYSEAVRDQSGKLQSRLFRKLINIVRPNDSIVVAMGQVYSNVTGYGSPWNEKISNQLRFLSDWKLVGKGKTEKWNDGTKKIGHAVTWKIEYSTEAGNGAECESWIRYGYGIDAVMEYGILGTDLGLIEGGGAWCTLNFGKDKGIKLNGKEKVREYLENNPDALKELDQAIRDMM